MKDTLAKVDSKDWLRNTKTTRLNLMKLQTCLREKRIYEFDEFPISAQVVSELETVEVG